MKFTNLNPEEVKAKKFTDLVLKQGCLPEEAAKQVGTTLEQIRTKDGLWNVVKGLIQRTEALLDPEIRKKLVKARLLELSMQDEDLKTALAATKAQQEELGMVVKAPPVALGIQVILKDTPQVKSALDSIDTAGELIYDEEKKVFRLDTDDDTRSEESIGADSPVGRLSDGSDGGGQDMDGVSIGTPGLPAGTGQEGDEG